MLLLPNKSAREMKAGAHTHSLYELALYESVCVCVSPWAHNGIYGGLLAYAKIFMRRVCSSRGGGTNEDIQTKKKLSLLFSFREVKELDKSVA